MEDESAVYGDILRLEYTETYSLLAFKTMSSLWLASTMEVQFIVKVDDDVYLHVPNVSVKSKLQHAPPPPRAYPGHLTPLPSRGGGNLIIRVFQGVGNLIPML